MQLLIFSSSSSSSLPPPLPDVLINEIPAYWFEAHSHFSQHATFYLWHGLAFSTQKTYSSGQQSYIDFVRVCPSLLHSPDHYLPATNHRSLECVTSLGDRALMPKTIKSYISSVCSLHVNAGLPFECCKSPTVQCLVRGIKFFYRERVHTLKLPIMLAILRKLTSVSGNLSFDAAIKLAWAGFLRCGEFTVANRQSFDPTIHLTCFSVKFAPSIVDPTHIRLTLPLSKTNPFRKGVSILIAMALGNRGSECVQFLHCNTCLLMIHSLLQTLLYLWMVLASISLEIYSSLSLNIVWQSLVWIRPSILVTASIRAWQLLPLWSNIQTMRFNCLGIGAVMLTNSILMCLMLAFSTSHLISIWPLLLLQFLTLRFSLLLLFWLELDLSHFCEEVL